VKFWKDRYEAEGIDGLATKPRSGHPKAMSEKRYQSIKREVTTKNQGWETKQIRELIRKKSGVLYSERHVIRIAHDWGLSLKVPRPIYAHTDERERGQFLKKTRDS
jgi:transposase